MDTLGGLAGGGRAAERLFDLDDSLDSYSRLEAMFSVDGSEALTGSLIEDPSELLRSSAGTARGAPLSGDWLLGASGSGGKTYQAGAGGPGPATLGFLGQSARSGGAGGAGGAAGFGSQAFGSTMAASTLSSSAGFSFGVPGAGTGGAGGASAAGSWRPDASGGTVRSSAAPGEEGLDLDSELQESVVRFQIPLTELPSLSNHISTARVSRAFLRDTRHSPVTDHTVSAACVRDPLSAGLHHVRCGLPEGRRGRPAASV